MRNFSIVGKIVRIINLLKKWIKIIILNELLFALKKVSSQIYLYTQIILDSFRIKKFQNKIKRFRHDTFNNMDIWLFVRNGIDFKPFNLFEFNYQISSSQKMVKCEVFESMISLNGLKICGYDNYFFEQFAQSIIGGTNG